jgi:hypothetical protein
MQGLVTADIPKRDVRVLYAASDLKRDVPAA